MDPGAMSRRHLLCAGVGTAGAVSAFLSGDGQAREAGTPPNIVVFVTDQQNATMLSCAGNGSLKTPAMDRLAADGVRFERAYTTNPVCLPARFTMMTGHYATAAGIRCNDGMSVDVPEPFRLGSVGWRLREAGYETTFGGGLGLPPSMGAPDKMGFGHLTSDGRDALADRCAEYLKRDHEKPFCLFVNFINPHDICYMAHRDVDMRDPSPEGIPEALYEALQPPEGRDLDAFLSEDLPALPANFEPPEGEPDAITWLLNKRPFRMNARKNWGPDKWRLRSWAYCRLTERVDGLVGRVLDALDASGHAEETLVICMSDHGDVNGAHRMEHKTALYEEAVRVPCILRYPGHHQPGQVDTRHLVSSNLDLVPTLCDYAGVSVKDGLPGRSLRPLVEGQASPKWRKTLRLESEIGDVLLTDRYKYWCCLQGSRREFLTDMKQDPGEMRNLAGDPRYEDKRKELRAALDRELATGGPKAIV